MNLRLIPKSQQITSAWSGGTTTQLFIYPENANYQDRNFLFRISTVTVEAEESVFTKLPGISRQLMILKGRLILEHTGKYRKTINKFETDSFEGDWETKGFGRVTDFNLMTTGKVSGSLKGKSLNAGKFFEFRLVNPEQVVCLYLFSGKLNIITDIHSLTLDKMDLLMILIDNYNRHVTITALEDTELVIGRIHIPIY